MPIAIKLTCWVNGIVWNICGTPVHCYACTKNQAFPINEVRVVLWRIGIYSNVKVFDIPIIGFLLAFCDFKCRSAKKLLAKFICLLENKCFTLSPVCWKGKAWFYIESYAWKSIIEKFFLVVWECWARLVSAVWQVTIWIGCLLNLVLISKPRRKTWNWWCNISRS